MRIILVRHGDAHLMLEDGNHRVEGLRRAGHDRYWAVVAFEDADQRRTFIDGRG